MTPQLYTKEPREWVEKSLCLKSPMLLGTIFLARAYKYSFQGTHKENHTQCLVSTLRSPKPRLLLAYPANILATDLPLHGNSPTRVRFSHKQWCLVAGIPPLPDMKGGRARKLSQSNFPTDEEKKGFIYSLLRIFPTKSVSTTASWFSNLYAPCLEDAWT